MADFATDWAIDNCKNLEPSEFKVLVLLCRRLNGTTGKCFPKISKIAEDVGLSPKYVQRILGILSEKKYIHKIARYSDNRQTSNSYLILVPKSYLKARKYRYYPIDMGKELQNIGWASEDLEVSMEEFVEYWSQKNKNMDFRKYESIDNRLFFVPLNKIKNMPPLQGGGGPPVGGGDAPTTVGTEKRSIKRENKNTPPISPVEVAKEVDPLAFLDIPEKEEKSIDLIKPMDYIELNRCKEIKITIDDEEVKEAIFYSDKGEYIMQYDYPCYQTELESFYINYVGTIFIKVADNTLDGESATFAKFDAIRRLYFKRTGKEWLMTELFRKEKNRDKRFFWSLERTDLGFNKAIEEKWAPKKVPNHHQDGQDSAVIKPPTYAEIASYWNESGFCPAANATATRRGSILKLFQEVPEFKKWPELIDRLAENPDNLQGGTYEKKIYQFLNEDFIANLTEGKFDCKKYSYV